MKYDYVRSVLKLAIGAEGYGTGLDVFLGTIATTAVASTGNDAIDIANDTIYYINDSSTAIATKDYGKADFAELFKASGEPLTVTTTDAAHAIIVVCGSDVTQVYAMDNGTGTDTTIASGEVSLIAVLDNAAALTADNLAGVSTIA